MVQGHPPEHADGLQLVLVAHPVDLLGIVDGLEVAPPVVPAAVRRRQVALQVLVEDAFRALRQVVLQRAELLDDRRPGLEHRVEGVAEICVFLGLWEKFGNVSGFS